MKKVRSGLGIVVLCLPALAAGEVSLRAGVSRIDITPPVGHAMGGYGNRTAGATGTHDPLYATVLVLESGETSLALVTCDLRSFVSARVGEMAKRKFGVGNTVISVSHTHSGPLTWELRSSWYAEAEDKMVAAIGEARRAMFPAQLSFASGQVYLGFNRRKVTDGRATMWWRNVDKLPSSPIDPTVNVLSVGDATGKTRAVLVNYACHPSILGPDNLQYSADYPGAMKRYVESQTPGALCLFIQGAAGDINPYRDKQPVNQEGFAAVQEMGEQLGRQVMAALSKSKPVHAAPLKVGTEVLEVNNRWNPEQKITIGMTAGAVGDELCFMTIPGEPFVELQMTFREKAECGAAMLFGYSYSVGGGWAGYLPTVIGAVEGGYGADYNTTVAVGAGEMLIDRGVVHVFKLGGLLKDLPDPRF